MRILPLGASPGDSVFHRLDPRTKLLLAAAATACSVCLQTLPGVAALAVVLAACHAAARTFGRLKWIAGYFLALWLVLVAAYVLCKHPVRSLADLAWTKGVFQLFGVMAAGLLLAFTTPPSALLCVLDKSRVPPGVTFAFAVMLRQVRVLAGDLAQILDAMKLRGLTRWRVFTRPRLAGRAVLAPLAVRAIRSADELAAAAETRGVGSPGPKTYWREPRLAARDALCAAGFLLAFAALIVLDRWFMGSP